MFSNLRIIFVLFLFFLLNLSVFSLDLPDWFLNPPTTEKSIYGIGVGQKTNAALSLESAKQAARNEIIRTIEVKVVNIVKDFTQETKVKKETELIEFTQIVSKSAASNMIVGSKVVKQHVDNSTNPPTYYVLIELPLNDFADKIKDVMKKNKKDFDNIDLKISDSDFIKKITKIDGKKVDTTDKKDDLSTTTSISSTSTTTTVISTSSVSTTVQPSTTTTTIKITTTTTTTTVNPTTTTIYSSDESNVIERNRIINNNESNIKERNKINDENRANDDNSGNYNQRGR